MLLTAKAPTAHSPSFVLSIEDPRTIRSVLPRWLSARRDSTRHTCLTKAHARLRRSRRGIAGQRSRRLSSVELDGWTFELSICRASTVCLVSNPRDLSLHFRGAVRSCVPHRQMRCGGSLPMMRIPFIQVRPLFKVRVRFDSQIDLASLKGPSLLEEDLRWPGGVCVAADASWPQGLRPAFLP